ncbi:hypothetical protein G7074_22625 [Pedobacter sp. HDW13]|uniref:hypothetical protein n=1 Tax=Pedobacter sp. HDW13 TaxID=2714940 RepID=UPI00140BACAF|nr:hypothetical protein [Pedobacter sp. HDW13]QIL41814.1 hypothetical protein G7074_22625 [Pedobacter sp. HDW13]
MVTATVNLFNKIFAADKWNIGFVHQTPENLIETRKLSSTINWLPEDDIDYAADPFVVNVDNTPAFITKNLIFGKVKERL